MLLMDIKYKIVGQRNPIISLQLGSNTFTIQTIGDPHLGKSFKNGVPRNRLGDREGMVKEVFKTLLKSPSDYTVILGDLFDKFQINNETLESVANIIATCASENPSKKYIILSGNHDLSKDSSRVSSFELLASYFRDSNGFNNVEFISQYREPIVIPEVKTLLYFSHYNPFKSLDDELQTLNIRNMFKSVQFKIAFGHWDTIDYDSNKYINRKIPEVVLRDFNLIVTGHEHKPTFKIIEDRNILISGSMQPYAFNEEIESDGDLYVNITAEAISQILEEKPEAFINSNVRIHYDPTKELVPPFPCLSCVYKIVEDKSIESSVVFEHELNEIVSFRDMFLNILEEVKTETNLNYVEELKTSVLQREYNASN